jgi:hypothetical protein
MKPIWLGLLGLLFYAGASQLHAFEKHAANEIKSKLSGGHATVQVRAKLSGNLNNLFGDMSSVSIVASNYSTPGLPLFTEPERSHRGRIGMLHLDLTDFTLGALRIQSLQANIPDCRFDLPLAMRHRTIRLSQSGTGTGSVQILQADLEAFILRKYVEIKQASVKIANGRVHVDGYGEFIIVKTNFSVDAKLHIVDGSRLELTDADIRFDGQPADEAARTVLLKTLNPVVDLDRDLALHGAIQMQDLKLENGLLTATGATRIPELPKEGQDQKPRTSPE